MRATRVLPYPNLTHHWDKQPLLGKNPEETPAAVDSSGSRYGFGQTPYPFWACFLSCKMKYVSEPWDATGGALGSPMPGNHPQ